MSNNIGCPSCGSQSLTLSRLDRVEFEILGISKDGEVSYDEEGETVDNESSIVVCTECYHEGEPEEFVLKPFRVTLTVSFPINEEQSDAWYAYAKLVDNGTAATVGFPHDIPRDGKVAEISVTDNSRPCEPRHRNPRRRR